MTILIKKKNITRFWVSNCARFMPFYYTLREKAVEAGYLVYVGKDKHENEVWFNSCNSFSCLFHSCGSHISGSPEVWLAWRFMVSCRQTIIRSLIDWLICSSLRHSSSVVANFSSIKHTPPPWVLLLLFLFLSAFAFCSSRVSAMPSNEGWKTIQLEGSRSTAIVPIIIVYADLYGMKL